MSPAEVGALKAVERGDVIRIYRESGNVLRGGGTNGATLWRLLNANMIADGPDKQTGFSVTAKMVLTKAGQKALAENR